MKSNRETDRRTVVAGLTAAALTTLLPKKVHAMTIPPNGCDCQVHVIGPRPRYPMVADRAYTPKEASLADLRAHLKGLGLLRVVLVQPSVYGTDNTFMLEVLDALGENGRGIAVIDPKTPAAQLAPLKRRGVSGVRLNVESTGTLTSDEARQQLKAMTAKVREVGWHVQLYAVPAMIATLAEEIARSPVPIMLDHYAMLSPAETGAPRDAIMKLLGLEHVYVKISAPYRLPDMPDKDAAVDKLAASFIALAPRRVVWASDWPHTNRTPGVPPTEPSEYRVNDDNRDLSRLMALGPEDVIHRILVDNPARLHGFKAG